MIFDLMDEFQFGPHRLKVTGMHGKVYDDPERMITAKCIDTCCSDPIHITMPAHELEALAKDYTEKVGTALMLAEVSRIMKTRREKCQKGSKGAVSVSIDE